MKLKFTVLIAALLVSHFTLIAQEQKVKLEMVNGDQVDFVTDLIIFKGTAVLPDDANDFIKGTVDGKKTKFRKSEIKKIDLPYGPDYTVFESKGKGLTTYFVGYFVTTGNLKVFKIYLHTRRNPAGMGTTINKVTTQEFYVLEDTKLRRFDNRKDTKKMAESCEKFSTFLAGKQKIKDDELDEAFKYYDTNCK